MPVFHDLGLIFIHIPKNAGRSVEAALLRGRGSPDGGRRSAANRLAKGLLRATRPRLVEAHLIGTLDLTLAAQHLTYAEIELLGLLPAAVLRGFRSVAVCRNPFDRAVSSVLHFSGLPEPAPGPRTAAEFERRLDRWLDAPPADHNRLAHRRPQLHYLTDRAGDPAVRRLLRYETLERDFAELAAELGHPGLGLPQVGRSRRSGGHRDYFTDHARRRIEQEFGCDLDAFGYAF